MPPAARLLPLLLALCPPTMDAAARKRSARPTAPPEEWDPASIAALDSDTCSVTRIPAAELTPERFNSEFRGQKPVVIEGLTLGGEGGEGWAAHQRWQKAALLASYGARSVAVREHTEADRMRQANGHGGSRRIPLSEYIHDTFERSPLPVDSPVARLRDVTYQFDRDFLKNSAAEMMRDFTTPPHFAPLFADKTQEQVPAPFLPIHPGPHPCQRRVAVT